MSYAEVFSSENELASLLTRSRLTPLLYSSLQGFDLKIHNGVSHLLSSFIQGKSVKGNLREHLRVFNYR